MPCHACSVFVAGQWRLLILILIILSISSVSSNLEGGHVRRGQKYLGDGRGRGSEQAIALRIAKAKVDRQKSEWRKARRNLPSNPKASSRLVHTASAHTHDGPWEDRESNESVSLMPTTRLLSRSPCLALTKLDLASE